MIKDWSKASTYIGVGSIGLGFLLIFLAWNGSSSLDYTQGQIPFLISGGVGGLSLVVLGAVMLLLQNARRDRASVVSQLERLEQSMEKVARAMTFAGNGSAISSKNGLVVAGATSYHTQECRLVQGRDEALKMAREEAEERGLNPCRICKP